MTHSAETPPKHEPGLSPEREQRRLTLFRLPFLNSSFAERAADPTTPEGVFAAVVSFVDEHPTTEDNLRVYTGPQNGEAHKTIIYGAHRIVPEHGNLLFVTVRNEEEDGVIAVRIQNTDHVTRENVGVDLSIGYDGSVQKADPFIENASFSHVAPPIEAGTAMLEQMALNPSVPYVD